MTLPLDWVGRLTMPVIAAPMFLVSNPALAVACCQAGIVGTVPALNQRSTDGFAEWVDEIEAGRGPVPYGVNLIVHASNRRLEADLAVCVARRVPLVITSLGANADVVREVQAYGGVVFHDVVSRRHAEKAAEAGADGLILVCAGAGGHAGTSSPFALLPEVRSFYSGTIVLAGAISDGRSVAAARVLGADLAYIGTRFIATEESAASSDYKRMVVGGSAADVVYASGISAAPANFLKNSLLQHGFDPNNSGDRKGSFELAIDDADTSAKPWRDVWSAGQGIGSISDVPSIADLVSRMRREYEKALTLSSL
ncbi:MAG: nitronate monooxygenase [Hyphomicrobiaceae bacterium]|nr:nitronate monooxygenase [Hyphomicrobiaceae bacterium]